MLKRWRVTIKAAGNPDWTTEVEAPEGPNGWTGRARTRAMLAYPHSLNGQEVTYDVTEIKTEEN
jgi:hypothetical protein